LKQDQEECHPLGRLTPSKRLWGYIETTPRESATSLWDQGTLDQAYFGF